MKTEILKKLKMAGTYVSGQALCEEFGVSRTAVWKAVRQLQDEGHAIEAVRNRGYLYQENGGDIYTKAGIQSLLHTKVTAQNLAFYEETDSTNNQARRLAEEGAPDGTLVVAVQQTAGKGRRGRGWTTSGEDGVWMSLLLRPSFPTEAASMLTLIAAMAVQRGISQMTGLDCKIKWPNDLVVDGKKICGILTEMSTESDYIRYVVVGIGINVGVRDFPEELRDKATSIYLCQKETVGRAPLAAAVMDAWENYYNIFQKTLDLQNLREEYNRELVNTGKAVKVLTPGDEYIGIARGIDPWGKLLVETEDGRIREVMSGEVSVRGVYGYV